MTITRELGVSRIYWKEEYQKFIDGVLRKEQRQLLEKAELIGQEITYLEGNRFEFLSDNPKHSVLCLYTNYQLSFLEPKCCYPRIHDEYSDSALEILDKYGQVNGDDFVIWLDKFLHDLWSSFNSHPSSVDEWRVVMVKAAIVKKLEELYKRQWGYVDGKPLKSMEYWNYHYDGFLEQLREDQQAYLGMADRFDSHIQWLTEEQESLFAKHEPKDYVTYLYINQELNRLDPVGWGYPGRVWDEYYDYAWEIVNLFKAESGVGFTQKLTDYLEEFFDTFYCSKSTELIEQAAERIESEIRVLDPNGQNTSGGDGKHARS